MYKANYCSGCSYCETLSQAECTHDLPADHEFVGAWVSCELHKALEKSYLVTNVSEIWQFRVTRFEAKWFVCRICQYIIFEIKARS